MLVAVDESGRRHTATPDLEVVPRCPDCQDALLVRLSANRVPHFAHYPNRRCDAATTRASRRRSRTEAARQRRLAARVAELDNSGQPGLFDLAPAGT